MKTLLCLAAAVSVWAQDSNALLPRSNEALTHHRTYQYVQSTSTSGGDFTFDMLVRATHDGKMRQESNVAGKLASLYINDGQTMTTYVGFTNKYMTIPVGTDPNALLAIFGADLPDFAKIEPSEEKITGSETIQVDGQPHDCWLVASDIKDLGTMTHWIDKVSYLELKSSMSGATTVVTTRHNFKFDEPLDDSLFMFTPPEGATQTDELFPGMKPKAKSPQSASAVASGPSDPRAYVPMLTPIESIDPVYPAEARAKNVRGDVQILISIDAAGSVITAEALTGPALLRPAAIDAVKQERFHPVLRDGHPVVAYSEVLVNFFDGTKLLNDPLMPNMNEEMAAFEMLDALLERFPRSPQQILADLEQDLGGVHEASSAFTLPRLAKAALEAGDLDKASSYARELLADHAGDSQAIHDGHMVLGVVSLRRGNVIEAKHHLHESVQLTANAAVLSSFGPNMRLAKELLEKGETAAVLEYFDACRAFWKMGAKKLDAWSAAVRDGRTPDFGANLSY